jgi:sugar lactone lactonase YvrE
MLLLGAGLLASGCMWGVVRNANTGTGIDGATVAYTDSNGNTGTTTTTAGGLYFFNGGSSPAPAMGTVHLEVSAPGYSTLTTDRTVQYNDNPGATLANPLTFWEVQAFELVPQAAHGDIDTLASGLGFPTGAVYDSDGNLYVSERDTCRVRKIDGDTGTKTTVAGNGTCGYAGDGGPATSAELADPSGLALDSNGNLAVADNSNCRVRMVDLNTHVITTVAGNGTCGFAGDGGAATSAQLGLSNSTVPSIFVWSDIAFGPSDSLYIADIFNCRIRRVSGGTITTIAGSGATGFTCGAYSGDGGPATLARLNQPSGVAVNAAGEVFIGELGGCRVRKVGTGRGHPITTIAGNGSCTSSGDGGDALAAGVGNVRGLALDAAGDVYLSQFRFEMGDPIQELDCEVRRVDASDGKISAVAGNGTCGFSGDGGLATAAEIQTPGDIALACNGDVAFSEALNDRVRVVFDVSHGGSAPDTDGDGTGDVCQ